MRDIALLISILIFVSFQSCSPRFAEFDSYQELWEEAEIMADTINWSQFNSYKLRIDPIYFFQNDQITYTLASKQSTGLRKNGHLFIRTGKNALNKDEDHHYAKEWAEFLLWVPKEGRSDSRVYFMSLSGRDSEQREVRIANVFHGQFRDDPDDGEQWISQGYRLLNVDYRGKVGADKKREIKKYKKSWKNKFMLILKGPEKAVEGGHEFEYYEAVALIDKGHKAGKVHMSVYELDKIFGENFYLTKE